ncbi:MAG: YkgJ family cysteine cluster protein [Desulfurivibrionaceae bacterium]
MYNNSSESPEPEVEELKKNEIFYFNCHPGVPCFTDCCRKLDLELTPYDVLRLKKRLGLTGRKFLDQYVDMVQNKETVFPRCFLKMDDNAEATCPFLTSEGCRVYEDRPGACRTYPLGRGAWQDKQGNFQAAYVLLKEAHCLGFTEENRQTVKYWLEHQYLTPYNEANDHLMTLLYHPMVKAGFYPSERQSRLYIETLYYLEELRESVKEEIGVNMSDTSLLNYGINLLKMFFFKPSGECSCCSTGSNDKC